MWVFLVLFYGIAKGFRDVIKKKALTRNTVMEVLFAYTLFAFIFCIPEVGDAINLPNKYYFLIAIKSIVIFFAWICGFKAIDHLPISLYGVVDLSRILFSALFGILILKEQLHANQMIGYMLVLIGLISLRLIPIINRKIKRNDCEKINEEESEEFKKENIKFILLVICSSLLNALSGLLDKIYMRGLDNSNQLQFWYMLYLVILYGLYFVFTKTKISLNVFKNKYIWFISILFFVADKMLFIANSDPNSLVLIMTLIKQSSCVVTIICGKLLFNEKNIIYKLICASIVITGIVLSVI